jgi:hypothetical protein
MKIFISYAREDISFVKQLEKKLKASDVDLWVDYCNVLPGDIITERVNEALEQCNTMLLVWSDSAKKSFWVNIEWGSAISVHKRIIPCVLDKTPIPPLLATMAYIDFLNLNQGMDELFSALESLRDKQPPQPDKNFPPKKLSSQSIKSHEIPERVVTICAYCSAGKVIITRAMIEDSSGDSEILVVCNGPNAHVNVYDRHKLIAPIIVTR